MPTTETRRLHPALLWGLSLAFALAIFIAVRLSTRDEIGIHVAPVNRQNLISSVSTNGKVEPIEQFQAYASAPGTVAMVYVKVGQKIRRGDLLRTSPRAARRTNVPRGEEISIVSSFRRSTQKTISPR